MDLNDLTFEITQGVADAELNISSSGILTGVINTILPEDCKTILTVTARDGQSKDIEVNWKTKLLKLKVSGFKDDEIDKMSELNGIYNILGNITKSGLAAEGITESGYKVIDFEYWPSQDYYHVVASTFNNRGEQVYTSSIMTVQIDDLTTVDSVELNYFGDKILVEFLK